MSGELFEDVQAAALVSRTIERLEVPTQDVAALERGRRERPDGTIETYERVEYRGRE